ncbi:hypothetical protein A6P55_06405 [Pandoraea pnomenusa]|uniref:Uncharacterized protein n=1 Tax=Pigmentiphaga daeguensis TaxID=414049 RepID=A0ABN1D6P3_9BURK|nr:hypothetical protein A6P55_06405 [Pandoraea pnomenusa]
MRRACQAQSQTGRYQSHHHVKGRYALDYQWLLIEFAEETIDLASMAFAHRGVAEHQRVT